MKFSKLLYAFAFLFIVFSCEKDNNIPINQEQEDGLTDNPFLANFGNSISASFIGQVVDENNQPIVGENQGHQHGPTGSAQMAVRCACQSTPQNVELCWQCCR